MDEFLKLLTEVKIGVCLGILEGSMERLDALLVDLRPANIDHLNGAPLTEREQEIFRAEQIHAELHCMGLLSEDKRKSLFRNIKEDVIFKGESYAGSGISR